jgi:hypothetical protein
MHIPHEEIRDKEDRSWSFRLVRALEESRDEDEIEEIAQTLQALDDYRTVEPLTALVENLELDELVREGACDALYGCTTTESLGTRQKWWSSEDETIKLHAVRKSKRSDGDLIERLASDPDNDFYIDAIKRMALGYEEERFQKLKINALYHSNPIVCGFAADTICNDEPVAAEDALIALAENEDDWAAKEALSVLWYYYTQKNLLFLHDKCTTGRVELQEDYQKAFEQVRDSFTSYFKEFEKKDSVEAKILIKWMQPVWHILYPDQQSPWKEIVEEESNSATDSAKQVKTLSVQDIINRFDNADGLWHDRWSFTEGVDWQSFSENEQKTLIKYFSTHPDWSVRDICGNKLAKMNATDALVELLSDPVHEVRKMASYYLCEVPKESRIAPILWSQLQNICVQNTYSSETLGSYVHHEPDEELLEKRLFDLALNEERTDVKYKAIEVLDKRKARKYIEQLVPLLKPEPFVNWGIHCAILNACAKLKIPVPNAHELAKIDDFFLQSSLAKVLANN